MKIAEECESLEEIRKSIDVIDKRIIDSLAQRSEYVKAASKYKKTAADVSAADRVTAMLRLRRVWAQENGLDPDFIEHLFENVVKYFIANEKQEWLKTNKIEC